MTNFGDRHKLIRKEILEGLGKSVSEQMRELEAHHEDQREANRILREWITDKTGTTDVERSWFVIRESFTRAIEKFGQSINEIFDPWSKYMPAEEEPQDG